MILIVYFLACFTFSEIGLELRKEDIRRLFQEFTSTKLILPPSQTCPFKVVNSGAQELSAKDKKAKNIENVIK